MNEDNLTNASILENKRIMNFDLPHTDKFIQSKYVLVIKVDTTNFTRLMIYPIDAKKILKVFFVIKKDKVRKVRELPSEFETFQIIHNSGLILREDKYVGEIYFNLSYSDSKYKDLKTYLNRNKSIFDKINLYEITTLFER
jgi:hypothetical protein